MPSIPTLRRFPPWALAASALVVALVVAWTAPPRLVRGAAQLREELEHSAQSKYSRIKVTRRDNTRTLWFVRDNGDEVIESRVDLERPDDLLIEYTRYMFMSYAFRPNPQKVLIVGLGGGSMVHFLQRRDPKVKVDVVEIDPVVASIADRYFGVRSGGNVDIHVTDGFEYLNSTESKYDVIYMDAFLRPSGGTDKTGVPLHLKTLAFYDQLKKRLNPDGVVMFNLNPHLTVRDDIGTIKEAFPNVYVFQLRNYSGYVVAASTAKDKMTAKDIAAAAAEIEARLKPTFSLRAMAGRLAR